VLIGNLDLVRDRFQDDRDGLELIDAALDAALRGADLNKRLLAFARRQSLEPERVDVGNTLADIVKLLKRSLGEKVEVQLVPDQACWPVKVDPSQLQNAIVNLGVNARDAMPGGGHLTIEYRNVAADDGFAQCHVGMVPGDYVAISVSDSGSGMTPEVLARVFEPFYTTKEVGKGTGLGLSMVHGFVNQSGGHVSIYSEPGKGTTVRLYLPRCIEGDRADRAAGSEAAAPPPVEPGGLLVLVVDDNPGILKVTVRQLRDLGYRTQEATNADEALAAIGRGVSPDILFTDIVMPGSMDGVELADRLRTVRPDLPVLLCSGFTERAAIDARKREGRAITDPLLAKPFRKDDLARALSTLRDKPGAGALKP
jgi:CheY-like chemotaxis protein